MSDFLRPVKDAVKQTPLWPVLRPRRIHIYGVGAPRTGTLSLARLFGEYRSAHEPHLDQTVELIKAQLSAGELRKELRRRDQRWRLECEVGFPLIYFVKALVRAFPRAKFICTVRPPRPWLRSIIDRCINRPRSEQIVGYRVLRDYCFGPIPKKYPPEEQVLSAYNLYRLDGYLSYWAYHYRTVLDDIPAGRRLLARTKDLSVSAGRIASFVGVEESSLCTEESHSHRTAKKHEVLEEIDESYLRQKIASHCSKVIKRFAQETQISLQTEGV